MNVPKSQSALQSYNDIPVRANLSSKSFISYVAEHKKPLHWQRLFEVKSEK
jgi:hypothetical protein